MSERRTRDRHGTLPGLLQGGSLAAGPWAGLTWQCLVGCLGGPLLPGAAPLSSDSSWLSWLRPSLAPVVAALGLTQSHR